jgi:NAD(P)H dehydrogenase (quinone)
MIVVTGSTGNVGGEAARLLAAEGWALRLAVRNPMAAPALPGAEIVTASYQDKASLARALRRGDHVFMVPVHAGHDDRLGHHRAFIEVAAEAGVGHLVYLSFVNAKPDAVFEHALSHWDTEVLIRQSGLPFTFLRMSLYASALPLFFVDGLMRAPGGSGTVGWVDRRDCGAMVAAVLRDPERHAGATYDLTGPEALSLDQSAARISRLLGRDYRYEAADDIAHIRAQLGLGSGDGGAAEWEVPARRSVFLAIAKGDMAAVSDDIARVAGIAPRPVDAYILAHPEQFPPPETHPS